MNCCGVSGPPEIISARYTFQQLFDVYYGSSARAKQKQATPLIQASMGQMKGLQQFISDLRIVQSQEEHDRRVNLEIVNIQKQFTQKLSGYQKKKYVSKLVYIYLTSNCNIHQFDVRFGGDQARSLVASTVYSEKFTGYLAISLMNDPDEQVIESIRKDLASPDQESNILALQCIASLGNHKWSELFVESVFQTLRSATAPPLLKKKAALAMLKLVRSNKESLLRHQAWIPRILAISDDPHWGVFLSILPLIEFIALEIDLTSAQQLVPTMAKKLSLLVLEPNSVPHEYIFNGIVCPWTIIKICKLLTILIPDSKTINVDLHSLRLLRECVSKSIGQFGIRANNDTNARTVHNSILLAVISLATHLDPSPEALKSSIDAITKLLDSKEMNTRYLALDSLITLSSQHNSLQTSQRHLLKILQLLKDQDTSIGKKALELVYVMTDSASITYVVSELFKLMPTVDSTLRYEISIKISVLAERFGTSAHWYVSTMLELIDTNGSTINDSIWERIVQIVVNNENLHSFTCSLIMKYITKKDFTESMVKIACHVIGEFGILIGSRHSISQQFDIMIQLYFFVSNDTRGMILLALMKLLRFTPDDKKVKSKLIKILRMEVNSINSELQQRSFEYLNLIQRLSTEPGRSLFMFTFAETPAFNTKQNTLMLRLGKSNSLAKRESIQSTDNLLAKPDDKPKLEGPLSPNWQAGFYRLYEFDQGIFFENSLLKVVLRVRHDDTYRHLLRYHFQFLNKSPQPMQSFLATLTNYKTVNPGLVAHLTELPATEVPVNGRSTAELKVTLRIPFPKEEIPNLRIQFSSGGGFNNFRLKLPIFMSKFLSPTDLALPVFLQHWKRIEALKNGEATSALTSDIDRERLHRLLGKLGLSLIEQGSFIFASGILHTAQGKFGTLLKVKTLNPGMEFSMRVTEEGVAYLLLESLIDFLKHHVP